VFPEMETSLEVQTYMCCPYIVLVAKVNLLNSAIA
jgi:hypothetical protein